MRRAAAALLGTAVTMLCLPIGSAQASAPIVSGGYSLEVLAYDGFDYPVGNLVPNAGGSGWTAAWSKSYGVGGDYQVIGTGLTYPGLDVTGGAVEWGFGGNQINGARRELPRVAEGVVYLQVLTHYANQTGFGTPNLRLYDDSSGSIVQTGALGANGAMFIALLDPINLQPLASSTATLNALRLSVVRFDYEANETSLWVDPDLSTFDYAAPPAADAVATGFAPTFTMIDPFTRIGSRFDELKVMRLVPPAPPAPAPPAVPAEPPLAVMAVPGSASATVSWQPPDRSGSFAITHYLVTSSPGSRTCLTTQLDCKVTNLTNGVAYTFTVQALTGAGWGARSAPSEPVTPEPAPQPSLLISGARDGAILRVSGTALHLVDGSGLTPWVSRDAGEFVEGVRTVGVAQDGTFAWQRLANPRRTWRVEFRSGALRSNTLTFPSRA